MLAISAHAGRRAGPVADTRAQLYSMAVKHAFFAVVPVLFTAWCIYISFRNVNMRAVDFHHEFWPAAVRVLHGANPYGLAWQNFNGGVAFPYPALTAVAFVPLALLPHAFADALYTAALLGATLLTLVVLKVRDWRIFGVVLLWGPVAAAWQSANLTLLLLLGIACLWRVRHRPFVAGLLLAILVSLKPFVWPLAIWLVATRRWRALGCAAACAGALNLIAWSVVGVSQVHAYRHVVQRVTAIMEHRGYSLINFASHLGAGQTLAYLIMVAVVAGVLAGCLLLGYRGDDRGSLALSIAAAILATPVLWTHYFALAIVPLALARPRLSWGWMLPILFWLCPSTAPATWQIGLALLINAAVFVSVLWRPDPHLTTRWRSNRLSALPG